MKHWETISSTILINDAWLTLTADTFLIPNGQTITPYYVLHEADWVHVFAQADDGRILTVKQFRYAAKTVCIELPGGVIDNGETPLCTAQRELLEETGYTATHWQPLGKMYANPARQTNTIHIFFATGLKLKARQQLDASEDIEFNFLSLPQIQQKIETNEFSQALHIASFYRALQSLTLNTNK
ncbi:NUDIX hydrolase [Undibacterium sp. KW1]|uniref:NUDIX hydrolase n=1 Tax=Undibacterium sp. KW1 TaxID=2058624 RepID=UPI001331E98C|nr:NUDIX hydrolase [Undibacterium sp. KW1]BBB60758.1 NUDIX hydrolase [Undibacterium sp. KW1]